MVERENLEDGVNLKMKIITTEGIKINFNYVTNILWVGQEEESPLFVFLFNLLPDGVFQLS